MTKRLLKKKLEIGDSSEQSGASSWDAVIGFKVPAWKRWSVSLEFEACS
jgi:hypothetical protein